MTIKLSDYRPYHFESNPSPFSTQVEADDPTNPTNWVNAFTTAIDGSRVVPGDYELMASWFWRVNSTARSAYFRFEFDIAGQISHSDMLRIESGDQNDVNDEFLRDVVSLPAGVGVSVTAQCLLEAGGGTSTLTIETEQIGISIECKSNAPAQ